jgi:filamentous hemagglutinin
VAEGKLGGYLLNEEHPDGGAKARALAAVLGYGPGDAGRLRVELLSVVAERSFVRTRPARQPPGALAYTVEGLIGGPNGRRAPARTVWQVDAPGEAPYLSTAYLIGRAVPDEPLKW